MNSTNKLFRLFLASCFIVSLASCGNKEENKDNVVITLTGFNESHENFDGNRDIVSKTTLAQYVDIQAVTLAFYNSRNQQVFKETQLRADYTGNLSNFGRFATSLKLDDYRMVAIAYKNESELTLNSPAEAVLAAPCKETFTLSEPFSVTTTGTQQYSKELHRINTRLLFTTTDTIPDNVAKIRFTFTAGDDDSFNPTTGLATANGGFTSEVTLTRTGVPLLTRRDFFLASDEEAVGISYQAMNADGDVLYSKNLGNNITFQRNKVTKLRGSAFSATEEGSFTVSTAWINDTNNYTFK